MFRSVALERFSRSLSALRASIRQAGRCGMLLVARTNLMSESYRRRSQSVRCSRASFWTATQAQPRQRDRY
ncbi:MAG: hypothetical protein AUG49_05760 [Catenulispora sp. 13_1_20CM_3_70_7]|nr:MAG: hypothetical protein AUG49_05760 [Catenulispora sp. 13_1_20CM_3_70_7]